MNARDYSGEVRALIDKATSVPSYLPAVVAADIVAELRRDDPELLAGWLDSQALVFLRETINRIDHSRRARALGQLSGRNFQAAVAAHKAGDSGPIASLLGSPWLCADGSKRPLGTMRRDDLVHASETYRERARQNSALSAFLAALARKVGNASVAECYTEEQLRAMFGSFTDAAA